MQVKLTLNRGGHIYVNMDHIISYVEVSSVTYLKPIKGNEIQVKESAEDIFKQMVQHD
jgi:uncharacterized protein YlzI (FlbEa/FlbD family)